MTGRPQIVEEFGLWSSNNISMVDAALRTLFKARPLPFGGVRVVFIGDEGQIKPRDGKPASAHHLLRTAPRIELTESRRYAGDSDWGHLLRELQKPQIPGGLADQLVRVRRRQEPPPGSLILAQSRADVRANVRRFLETDDRGILLVPSDVSSIAVEKDAEDGRFVPGLTEGWLVYGCLDADTDKKLTANDTLLTNGTSIRFEGVEGPDGDPIENGTVTMGADVIVIITLIQTGELVRLKPLEIDGHFVVPIRHGTFWPAHRQRR